MIKTNYAVLDVPYNYDFSNDVLDHHVYESCDREKIAAELIRMGATDEKYCVEIYKVNEYGEFADGSYCVTPCNFLNTPTAYTDVQRRGIPASSPQLTHPHAGLCRGRRLHRL